MLALKYLLEITGLALMAIAAALVLRHIYLSRQGVTLQAPPWKLALGLAGTGFFPFLAGLSIIVIPSGSAGVRVSQVSGTLPGTLYPGLHFVLPLVHSIETYDVRDQVYQTVLSSDPKSPSDVLKVQTREGMSLGLAVAVRYRVDAQKLPWVHANLPQPVGREIVPPVVATAFRDIAPNYLIREIFAQHREDIRKEAAGVITKRLAGDGIVVKEVMLRDIQMPAEYAKGLEGVLLKEQENERLAVEVEVKQKQVKTAELEAEALKARQIKNAEAEAQVTVLQAKAQSDAMQYTLPLKEKQIQQMRLEAEARAGAKLIDAKSELERRKLMNVADGEKMQMEAGILKQNPMLIQKIIAEKLSDKVQIMMVPSDGKYFFANDVLRGAMTPAVLPNQ